MIRTYGVRTFTCPPTDPSCSDAVSMKSLVPLTIFLTISWRQRGESTVLRGPDKRERNGGYEQPEVTSKDTSEDTSEDTTTLADADVTSSAASLVVTYSLMFHHTGRKLG